MTTNDRTYAIFGLSEVDQIEFDWEILETSADTLRKSVDQTKAILKWECDHLPVCLVGVTTLEGPYTLDELTVILATPEWLPTELI